MVLAGSGSAYPHPMGYVLTENYGIPHGRACAVFLPALVKYAKRSAPEVVREILGTLGMTFTKFKTMVDTLAAVELHMDTKEAHRYAARWVGLKNFKNVPGGYDERRAYGLLVRLFVR